MVALAKIVAVIVVFVGLFQAGMATNPPDAAGLTPLRVTPMRTGVATWYGPGFYGKHTACGQLYSIRTRGVANNHYRCDTKLTIKVGGRVVRVKVIDTGGFSHEFDLSARTAMDLCRCWKPYTMKVRWRRGW